MKRIVQNNKIDLIYELVKTSFSLKYNGSILGFVWILLKPFLQFSILYIIFSNFSGNQAIENYTIYLLLGLVVFSFFQESILSGIHSLLEKAHIILKVNFDRSLAVFSSIFLAIINLFINFIIIIVFIVFNPIHPTLEGFLYFLFVILTLIVLVTGVSFFTSIIAVRVRDLFHLAEVGMQLMFYASGIFFDIQIVPEPYRQILELNPLYTIMQSARYSLMYGDIIYVKKMLVISVLSLLVFIFGFYYFKRKVLKVAEYF